MTEFRQRLAEAQRQKDSCVVVGLDPRVDQLPAECQGLAPAEAILAFNRAVIDATAGLCVAVKPQSAFYEQHGPAGFDALRETVRYAHDRGLLVIVDAKRGDVGPTAEAYAEA